MAGNRDYDPDRLEQLVLYIAWKTRENLRFGRTKLAKVLFYCDLTAYAEEGESLTGAVYQHWPHGPFPPALYEVEKRIESAGKAKIQRQEAVGDEIRIIPSAEQDPPLLHEDLWQRPLVDAYIDKFANSPTWEVEDSSHKHPGWELTNEYEEIPYHVAFMSRRRPTARDLERAEQLVVEHGWP
jgi:uncharacterized phage-associated protein